MRTGGRMAEGPDHEKLSAFFRELTPAARAKLASAITGDAGEAIPFRDVILEPLLAAQRALGEIPEAVTPEELLLAPADPFVSAEPTQAKTAGLIAQATRERLGPWLATTGAPDLVKELAQKLGTITAPDARTTMVEGAQDRLAAAIGELIAKGDTSKGRNRLAVQLGGEQGVADLRDVAIVLRRRSLLARFAAETYAPSGSIEEHLKAAKARLDPIAIKYREALPFALVLVRQKLPNPQTFVRLAATAVESTDGVRICETPYACILDLALAEAEREQSAARRHGSTEERPVFLRAVRGFGATVRALSTEIDLQPDGMHARRLAALRREMAESIRSDLQDLPPRVRRLVRPRPQERMPEDYELTRLEADLELLLIARSYAEEVALNALSGRVFSEVRELLDTGTPPLMERLRAADEKSKADLRARLRMVVSVSRKVFGSEYADLMSKAVEVAGHHQPQLRSA